MESDGNRVYRLQSDINPYIIGAKTLNGNIYFYWNYSGVDTYVPY